MDGWMIKGEIENGYLKIQTDTHKTIYVDIT